MDCGTIDELGSLYVTGPTRPVLAAVRE